MIWKTPSIILPAIQWGWKAENTLSVSACGDCHGKDCQNTELDKITLRY